MVQTFWKIINKLDFMIRGVLVGILVKKADIILMATSAQNNLGDHAISIAERVFLRKACPQKRIVEIPKELFYKDKEKWIEAIESESLIIITGGGFLGDLWISEERLVRDILNDFQPNRKIIFPQTVFFSKESKEYETSFECYKSTSKLIMNARDNNSFEILKKELEGRVPIYYFPDMVLSLKYEFNSKRKNIALCCIRHDKENNLSDQEIARLHNIIDQKRLIIKEITTVGKYAVPIFLRKYAVRAKVHEFAKAKVVITNRLHAMIFATISGTPCVALDNISHKVSGVYEWIKDIPYIKCIDNVDDMDDALDEVIRNCGRTYDLRLLAPFFEQLANEI